MSERGLHGRASKCSPLTWRHVICRGNGSIRRCSDQALVTYLVCLVWRSPWVACEASSHFSLVKVIGCERGAVYIVGFWLLSLLSRRIFTHTYSLGVAQLLLCCWYLYRRVVVSEGRVEGQWCTHLVELPKRVPFCPSPALACRGRAAAITCVVVVISRRNSGRGLSPDGPLGLRWCPTHFLLGGLCGRPLSAPCQ